MLSRLQAGVDAEVAKWQSKVASKDKELEEMQAKVQDLEKNKVQWILFRNSI